MSKIERKYMAHYLDANFTYRVTPPTSSFSPAWYRIGEDLEEYNVEMNPRIEIVQNWLGDDVVISDGYEMTGEAESYYAYRGDDLFNALQVIINNLSEGEACYSLALDVHMFTPGYHRDGDELVLDGYYAIMRPCYIVPVSYGGDTSGYQIPFTVYYLNNFTMTGMFMPDGSGSGKFTPDQ